MFYRLYADNYRCLANFELPLEALSVLVGPNGSGKSASLLLVAKLRDFILGRETSTDLFPTGSLTRWDTRGEQTFELGVRLAQGDYLYRLRLFHLPQNSLNRIEEEKLSLDGKPLFETRGGKTKLYSERHEAGQSLLTNSRNSGVSQVPDLPDQHRLIAFRTFLERTLVLALNPALVTAVSANKQPVTIPRPDCSDFSDFLGYITSAEARVRRVAERSLGEGALPGFEGFEATPSGDASILKAAFSTQGRKSLRYRLDELSSGQIALVILETMVALVAEHHGSLFLDEPGSFLSLSEISPLLTRFQDAACEGLYQVVLSTHHPIAVDFLAAGHGFWLDREPSGPTRVQRLQVSGDLRDKDAHLRVSDLIARGWLSGLGIHDHSADPEREAAPASALLSEPE